jgi:hypothetical protein
LRWITPPSANNSVTVRSSSTVSIRQSDLIFIMSVSLRRRGIGKKSDAPPRRRKDTNFRIFAAQISVR